MAQKGVRSFFTIFANYSNNSPEKVETQRKGESRDFLKSLLTLKANPNTIQIFVMKDSNI